VRSRPFIAIAAVLVVLLGLAGTVAVLDSRAESRIAEGVRVGNVDVGGLDRAQARAKLQRALLTPLKAPIVVHHDRKTWRLSAEKARIRANIDGMVDAALDAGRDDPIYTRAYREATSGRVNADLPARASFSRAAVRRLVDRVEKSIDRPARNADVSLSASGVSRVPGRTGLAVRADALERRIARAVTRPGAPRTFVAQTRKLQPEVTTEELEERYPAVVIVNRSAFRLTLYKKLERSKTYGIAVGQVGLETPAGRYSIQNKAIDPAWHVPDSDWAGDLRGRVIPGGTPENPLKARWLGIYDGAGIHGTDAESSIGTAASHGCIRMRIPEVKELYDEVPVGAPVYIA
jgi:lipoprotein-anchoring transpeptidase ErfK/SrfK